MGIEPIVFEMVEKQVHLPKEVALTPITNPSMHFGKIGHEILEPKTFIFFDANLPWFSACWGVRAGFEKKKVQG